MTAKIIQTNIQIFQVLVSVQNVVTRIPGQIERQQPVYCIDALGRHMAFHLEFVRSTEASTAVLRSNFRNIGCAAKKIEMGEFVIQDATTKSDVDLKWPWEACFSPGQHTTMSMVFNSANAANMSCPKCHDKNGHSTAQDEDIECRKCKMVYRRSVFIASVLPSSRSRGSSSMEGLDARAISAFIPEFPPSLNSRKRRKPHDEEKEMALFRRVRIKTEIKVLAVEPRNELSVTQVNDEISDADPELVELLEAYMINIHALSAEERRHWKAELAERREEDRVFQEIMNEGMEEKREIYGVHRDMINERMEVELEWFNDEALEDELRNEAYVEFDLNYRMMRDVLPSDSDDEDSENAKLSLG